MNPRPATPAAPATGPSIDDSEWIMTNRRDAAYRPRRAATGLALTLAVVVLLAPGRADAGPIRTARAIRLAELAQARATALRAIQPGSFWDRYFARALQRQMLRVRGPHVVQVLSADPNAVLPTGGFLDYMSWRRSLNPARFDFFHPQLAGLLTRRVVVPDITKGQPDSPGIVIPPVVPPPVGPEVPEPGMGAIALMLIGGFALGRRWAARQARG